MYNEDTWTETWLDRNYDGAPDECSWHFINTPEIIKLVDGKCPREHEH